ncbi:MAG: hypothetical protein ABFD10_22450 [Prolixibacteraceae bacterium]
MKKTKDISVGYEPYTTVLLLTTGMILLILLSVSDESLMNAPQSRVTIIFLFLMTGLVNMCILLPKSLLFFVLMLVGVVQVLYGKTLPVDDEHFKVIEIHQQATCGYQNTVEYTAIRASYKKPVETDKVEQAYLHAWYLNSSWFYPKYLLAKLYDESGQKTMITAKESLGEQVKTESAGIEEIRVEMEEILLKHHSSIKERNSTMSHPGFKLQKW